MYSQCQRLRCSTGFARLIESLEYFLLGFILYAATGVGKGQFQICASYGNISEMLPLLGVNLNAFDRIFVHILRILS